VRECINASPHPFWLPALRIPGGCASRHRQQACRKYLQVVPVLLMLCMVTADAA